MMPLYVRPCCLKRRGKAANTRGRGRRNNQAISDEDKRLLADDFDTDGRAQIAAGKKRRAILQLN